MAQVSKIDSNVTGSRIAKEASPKVLPGTPDWYPYAPNSYDNAGGNISTVASNPINDSRQRKKGVTTDLEAGGGQNLDLTQTALENILDGFLYAAYITKGEFEAVTSIDAASDEYRGASGLDIYPVGSLVFASGFADSANNGLKRVTSSAAGAIGVAEALVDDASPASGHKLVEVGVQAGAGDIDVDVSGTYPALTSTTLDFTTLGLTVGEFIFVGGDTATLRFSNSANNGFKRIRSIAANSMELDKSDSTMVTEASTTETVQIFMGRLLKNRGGSNIVKNTYQWERTLGAPDDSSPSDIQAEYLLGCRPNQMVFNIEAADKITVDMSFVAEDVEYNEGSTGVKSGNRPTAAAASIFNTSSDFSRISMHQVTNGDEAPADLFSFITDLTLTINNNVTVNKAVGVLGACGASIGTFEVSASMTAYFSNVTAINAVRNNANVTLDFAIAKENAGMVFDLPLVTLGDARADIQQDQPITLPISVDAASGETLSTDLNHTLQIVVFDYLPTLAQ